MTPELIGGNKPNKVSVPLILLLINLHPNYTLTIKV